MKNSLLLLLCIHIMHRCYPQNLNCKTHIYLACSLSLWKYQVHLGFGVLKSGLCIMKWCELFQTAVNYVSHNFNGFNQCSSSMAAVNLKMSTNDNFNLVSIRWKKNWGACEKKEDKLIYDWEDYDIRLCTTLNLWLQSHAISNHSF